MKTTHALVIFDYAGPDPRIPNVHAFGFMQTDGDDYVAAQDVAIAHWSGHFTYRHINGMKYQLQHVFAYDPAVLIDHLFAWGVDFSKFDPTLPKEA